MSAERDAEIVKRTAEKCRNWGRWGPEDQLGTVNYITPEKIIQAARLVRQGKVISLAIPFDSTGPQDGAYQRFNPMHFMLRDGCDALVGPPGPYVRGYGLADDVVMMPTHGATHWDALSHGFWDNKMWNGYEANLVSSSGAEKNGIENYRDKIVSRGVLLDIPRLKGVDHLEIGYAISNEDLEAAAESAGVAVGSGDIVLVRTGYIGFCRARKFWGRFGTGEAPGLSFWTAGWLHEREVAGVAADTYACEVQPNELNWVRQPWHRVVLPNMGILMGEVFDLDELAADCAADGVYEFLFVAPPLPLTGCVGSPVNPLAIK